MSEGKQSTEHHQLATQVIHGGKAPQDPEGALVAPLYQTSTFKFSHADQGSARFAGEEPGYIYSRLGNPTITQLETRVAGLEGFSAAAASATGMGAIAATTMALVRSGDHVLVSDAIYGCTSNCSVSYLSCLVSSLNLLIWPTQTKLPRICAIIRGLCLSRRPLTHI